MQEKALINSTNAATTFSKKKKKRLLNKIVGGKRIWS